MAWLFGDSFDFYNAAADMLLPGTPWSATTIGNAVTTTSRFGLGLSTTIANVTNIVSNSFTNSTTIWVNFAFQLNLAMNGTTTQAYGFDLRDGTSIQCGVYVRQDGSIVLTSNGIGGTVLATSSVLLPTGVSVWTHLQFKIVINNTTGSIECRLNGKAVDDWNATGLNTRNGTVTAQVNNVVFKGAANNASIDDFYVFNDQGVAPNNWQGDVRAVQQMPTSDSSVTWSRSVGTTNFTEVDELRENGDTDYVFTSTAGSADAYGVPGLATAPFFIVAVQTKMIARMDNVGPKTVKSRLNSGGTPVDSANLSLSSSYQWISQVNTVDPHTSAAWTGAAVAGVTIGPVAVL